jgi:lysophospholipid acyltransferase
MYCMGIIARCKYYFVWLWAEAACDASGLGWRAGASRSAGAWDRCRNIDLLGVEVATSASKLAVNWNAKTGLWLRLYVYERAQKALASSRRKRVAASASFLALLGTQLVSGLWHGVSAGYLLFFLSSAFMFHASKVLYKYQQALLPPAGPLRRLSDVLHGCLTAAHLNYLATVFITQKLPGALNAWKSVYFVGHVSMVVRAPLTRALLAADDDAAGAHGAGGTRAGERQG